MRQQRHFYQKPLFWGSLFTILMLIFVPLSRHSPTGSFDWWLSLSAIILAVGTMLVDFLGVIYFRHNPPKNG
ncbi:hypothetical protein ACFQ22_05300 [Lentilactobacillus raoultii]|uniref:Uncharacterized protein n=1 Tax=Lentilactobacillus raoultii TaxID=1987503 RepID=A0ABW3PI78_9LACO|nr:hypothetical protein [Lentilactobacillus raoultii]